MKFICTFLWLVNICKPLKAACRSRLFVSKAILILSEIYLEIKAPKHIVFLNGVETRGRGDSQRILEPSFYVAPVKKFGRARLSIGFVGKKHGGLPCGC